MKNIVSRAEILARLERCYGQITAFASDSSAPASRFLLSDGTVFGIIASTTEPFCSRCDRSRLTADGIWYRCLYAMAGTDLRRVLRSAAPSDEIAARIADLVRSVWRVRTDRGAERRKADLGRNAFVLWTAFSAIHTWRCTPAAVDHPSVASSDPMAQKSRNIELTQVIEWQDGKARV